MSENLLESKCEACYKDATALNEQEISEFLSRIPSWIVHEDDGIKRLICSFAFWWSHKIKGLHKNDFICASKTDELFKNHIS